MALICISRLPTLQSIINEAFRGDIVEAEAEDDMNAGEICTRTVVIAFKTMSVSEAARLMLEEHVGSLVVVEEEEGGRQVVGMLTDRDIVVAVVAHDFHAESMRVADIMSSAPITCRPEDSFAEVLSLMRRQGIRRVPVTDANGILVGILALDDLLEIVAEDLQGLAQVMKSEARREVRQRG
jgi:CBS domain-containing protein